MVTYFNRKDLVSFGSYLMSEERKALLEQSYQDDLADGVESPLSVEERMKDVYHSDIENWLSKQ